MARQQRIHSESGIYHVMLRGINRDPVFLEDADRDRFLSCLVEVKAISGCRVLAYCLMTNHVHLLLQTGQEPIGEVIKRLGVRYAGWFNRKYGRVGHLFQDRFKSKPVETDAYFGGVLRYIWNNPVEAGLTVRPEEYRWSSRRFLPGGSPLVDDAELGALIEPDALATLAAGDMVSPTAVAKPGRTARFTDEEAAQLLKRVVGAGDSDSFQTIDPPAQQLAVAQLRTLGVSYRQLARLTGISVSTLWRLHLAGPSAEPVGVVEVS